METASPTSDSLTSKDYYWNTYAYFRTHENLLKDDQRVRAFQKAILRNSHLFKDKVVLDVGSGTGILSLFAAKAGAKLVLAVECSAIVKQLHKIVALNKYEQVIKVIEGKIEEVELPVKQVDIIVSSWMGYMLLVESLIEPVIFARDKYLKPNGLIFPDKGSIYLMGLEDRQYKAQKLSYWDNVYGYDMNQMKEKVVREPLFDTLEPDNLMTNSACIFKIDLKTAKPEDLKFKSNFTLSATRRDWCNAIIAYFVIEFSQCHVPVILSTSPENSWTSYKQAVFYIRDAELFPREEIKGIFYCQKVAKDKSQFDIGISFVTKQKHKSVQSSHFYSLR